MTSRRWTRFGWFFRERVRKRLRLLRRVNLRKPDLDLALVNQDRERVAICHTDDATFDGRCLLRMPERARDTARPPTMLSCSSANHKPDAPDMYAIRRMKQAVNAWSWAVGFIRRGKPYAKRFYDQKHGGTQKALKAAIAWRDRTLARAGVFTHREFCQQKRSNNTSGVPGVHFLRPKRMPQGVWQARIKLPDGRKPHRTFSVRKFGHEEAFDRAVAARAEMLLMVEDRPYIKHPTAKRFAAKGQAQHAPRK